MTTRLQTALQSLLIVAVTALIYAPVTFGTWLWDDPSEILANPLLRSRRGLDAIWHGAGTPDYFPLKTSLQWLQWHLWRDSVAGYHLTNLGLHALAAILLWRLLARLGLRTAYFGALLFAAHPLAVESVAWMSELKNVLSLALLLGAALSYLDFDENGRQSDYALSLFWFAAAALAKSSVVMFPGVLLLYAFWRRGQIHRTDLAATAPFFLLSLGLGLMTVHFQAHRVMAYLPMPDESLPTRLAGAGWAIWFYLGKCLAPFGLLPIYPRWTMAPAGGWLLPPWLALAAVFAWSWRHRQTWGRTILFGLGSFVLNLLPALDLVPLAFARISRVSDHLAYLPLVSIVALIGAAAAALPRRRTWWIGATGLIAGALLLSRSYASQFVSEERLWEYTTARNPGAWLAQNNLGIVLAQSGRLEEAVPPLRAAVALRPDLFGARMNLARVLLQTRHLPEAAEQFAAAYRLNPSNADAKASLAAVLNNYANSLARTGRLAEAVEQFQKSLAVDPANAGVRRNLASALHALGRDREAVEQLDLADHLPP